MVEQNEIRELIENLRDSAAEGSDEVIDNALRHAAFIAGVAPRLPDHCFLQPNVYATGLPSVVLAWSSADENSDEAEGAEKHPGCMVSFDLSLKRAGFWAQRKLQRVTVEKDLYLFADETAARTDNFARDEQLIRIGFGWLEAEAVS